MHCRPPPTLPDHSAARSTHAAPPARTSLSVMIAGMISSAAFANTAGASSQATLASINKNPGGTVFDTDILKQRGLDPALAAYFGHSARFSPGKTAITLTVNGVQKGTVNARFDNAGRLCFDVQLMRQAELKAPDKRNADSETSPGCYDYRLAYPETVVMARPSDSAVDLLVPTQALMPKQRKTSVTYASGGMAALMNYDIWTSVSQNAGYASRYTQASTELGFNAGDWIVRSRQSISASRGATNITHLYAYGQRTFTRYRSTLQVGQINIANPVAPGAAIYGFQLTPESALTPPAGNGAVVDGIAQTQARIEVRQSGMVIYSTLVPPGPFSLRDLPLINSTADLDVSIIESTGETRRIRVPSASFASGAVGRQQGFSLAAGQIRDTGDNDAPWVVSGAGGWTPHRRASIAAGVTATSDYQGAGIASDIIPLPKTALNLAAQASNDRRHGARGVRASTSVRAELPGKLSAGASATWQSRDYHDLYASTLPQAPDTRNSYRSQYSASLGWSHHRIGNLGAGYSLASTHGNDTAQRLTGTWSRSWGKLNVSASADFDLGSTYNSGSARRPANRQFFVNVSVPLGKHRVNGYVNRVKKTTRYGAQFGDQINEYAAYSISAETQSASRDASISGNLNLLPRYTSLGLSYGRYSASSQSYSANLSGGVVLHQHGVTASPYPLRDTIGIASVGNISGVRINTPNGPVWTDAWGRAAVSQLPAYRTGRVDVATRTLPRNADIGNATAEVTAGRGSVSFIDFEIEQVRRVLLDVRLPGGAALPKGASVMDSGDNFVTAVGNKGTIFLTHADPSASLRVVLDNSQVCELKFNLPATPQPESFYERTRATCEPKPASRTET